MPFLLNYITFLVLFFDVLLIELNKYLLFTENSFIFVMLQSIYHFMIIYSNQIGTV